MKGKGSGAEDEEELEGQDNGNIGRLVTSNDDDDNGLQGVARPTSSSDRSGLDVSDEEREAPEVGCSSSTASSARTRAGAVPPLSGLGGSHDVAVDTPREDLSGTSSAGDPLATSVSPSAVVRISPEEQSILRGGAPRIRRIRRGVSAASWGIAIVMSTAAFIAGVPAGTMLLLIFTGIGYAGSEFGGSIIVNRLEQLEGGQLITWAEGIGGLRLNGFGDRLALAVLGYSLGTLHQRPTSIANAAQRARIQDRGVEFLALISALSYGGLGVLRVGLTADVLLSTLATFTTVITSGMGYLVITRRGAELHRRSIPRISAISDPVSQRARVFQGALYAPTTIGDFLIWCGVVGRPLIKAGLMLPVGLLAIVTIFICI